jgi:anti-anti-sigma factor
VKALSIQMAHERDHTTLALIGELDIMSAGHLEEAVEAALDDDHRHLTIDTAALTFCDSSGLLALLRARQAAAAVQGTLQLANVHGVLWRILDITQLAASFTMTQAPASFGNASGGPRPPLPSPRCP